MMPNETTLKKIFGDPIDEGTESLYRLAATMLVNAIEVEGIDRLGEDNALKRLLDTNHQLGEAVISFVVAAILELFPMSTLDDERKRLSYNLRVRTYEKVEELLLRATPFVAYVMDEAERAVLVAKGEKIEGIMDRAKKRGFKAEVEKDEPVMENSPKLGAGNASGDPSAAKASAKAKGG